MLADLKNLLALQEDDRVIMGVEGELQSLEPELAELDEVVTRLEQVLATANADLEEANQKRSELENSIETYRVMQERRRQKLEWVRGAKEASSLMAEIDLARGVLAQEETEWIRSADDVQQIEARARESEEAVANARAEQEPRRAEIATIQKECHKRLAAAQKKRELTAKNVTPRMAAMYNRIRKGRAPLAMYELHTDACGHCFTAVPMHLRQQIRRGDTLATCEACGVLIYVPE